MGIQQSTQKYYPDGIPQVSESMAICKIGSNELKEKANCRKFNIICRDSRRATGIIDIRQRKNTLYLYLRSGSSEPKLIKTSNMSESRIDPNYLLTTACVATDRFIGIPEMDIESNVPILTIYSLEKIIRTKRLRLVRSINLDPEVTVNRLVGNVLHQIYLHHHHNRVKIVSHELTGSRATRSVDIGSPVEKLRFSPSGSMIGIYGHGVLNIYRPSNTIDPDYRLAHTVKLVYSDRYDLIDLTVTDGQTAYYVMRDRDYTYHCVSILSGMSQNRIIAKTENTNSSLELHQIACGEYASLFVPDLDFYSSDGELVHLQNLTTLLDTYSDKVRIRILAEMTNSDVISSISLIGTYDLNIEGAEKSAVSDDGCLTVETDISIAYDLKKMVGPMVSVGLAKLIRGQIIQQIEREYPKAINLVKRVGIESLPSRIVVRAADDRDTKYDVTSSIASYSICISTIYESINKDKKNTDPPIYQLTVNSNMTLMDIKSYEVFERLLDGDIRPVDVVDKIFSHYPNSSYDRFQTTIEILDHIYDYTKFILLDIDLQSNQALDQIFGLYKKRVALLVAYICGAIVMDYYNREVDLPYCNIGDRQIQRTSDFDISDSIALNFHHNFQPFKTVMETHMTLLNIADIGSSS